MSTQFGSLSALSLMSSVLGNPIALAGIGVAAVGALTVTGVAIAYKKYENYEEKKHREEIEAINRLYIRYLSKIDVLGLDEKLSLPAIFKILSKKENEPIQVDSLHFTEEEIEDIGNNSGNLSDVTLSNYREYLLCAINDIKDYLLTRPQKDDVTAGVLSYLLYILEKKFLGFQGYDYDIAFVKGVAKFLKAYATEDGKKTQTQHASHLTPAYRHLEQAITALERHKASRTIDEVVSELKEAFVKESRQLIRTFTKLIVKEKYWPRINRINFDDLALAQGIIKPAFIDKEIRETLVITSKQKTLAESLFRDWIMALATYFSKTQQVDMANFPKRDAVPYKSFLVPDLNRLNFLSQQMRGKITLKHNKELDQIKEQLKQIRDNVFAKSQNFITHDVITPTGGRTQYLPIKEDKRLVERTQFLADFAWLIQEVISIQLLALNILESIKQAGTIYADKPHHWHQTFELLHFLCDQATKKATEIKNKVNEISNQQQNTMRADTVGLSPEMLTDGMQSLCSKISKFEGQITLYRENIAKNISEKRIASGQEMDALNHQLFTLTKSLADLYGMTGTTLTLEEEDGLEDADAQTLVIEHADATIQTEEDTASHSTTGTLAILPTPATTSAATIHQPCIQMDAFSQTNDPDDESDKHQQFGMLLTTMNDVISALEDDKDLNFIENEIATYQKLLSQLLIMDNKTDSNLMNRALTNKNNSSLDVLLALTKDMLTYLNLRKNNKVDQPESIFENYFSQLKEKSRTLGETPHSLLSIFAITLTKEMEPLSEICTEIQAVANELKAPRQAVQAHG